MRYWLSALLGIALSAAAVAVVTWCTYAWTRTSLCAPGDEQLACTLGNEGFAIAIAVAIFVVIPFASRIFMFRTTPRGTSLGFLTIGIAITAAGGAALYSALDSRGGFDSVQVAGYIVAGVALSIGPFFLLGGIVATGRSRQLLSKTDRDALIAANGGDVKRAMEAARASANSGATPVFSGSTTVGAAASHSSAQVTSQLTGLAAQLTEMAAARQRTSGDKIASSLRQLDDLRASGLLTAEEHERKRREILEQL